jgi:pimeloyl-ACP methyl ester carboxylesterase
VTNPLRLASWWLRDYAYAAFWQCRAFVDRSPAEPYQSGTARPIVVLPGVYETWRFMQPLVEALHKRGHPVHVIEVLRWNNKPIAHAAEQLAAYLEEHELHDVVLVAHSKGGLIGKYAMSRGGSATRIRSMLAVAAPFNGSRYARFMLAPSLRIFSPRNALILALAREQTINAHIVSVYGEFDPHVPGGSELPGAKNVVLDTGGHFRVLAHPRVMAELAVLAEAPGEQPHPTTRPTAG